MEKNRRFLIEAHLVDQQNENLLLDEFSVSFNNKEIGELIFQAMFYYIHPNEKWHKENDSEWQKKNVSSGE